MYSDRKRFREPFQQLVLVYALDRVSLIRADQVLALLLDQLESLLVIVIHYVFDLLQRHLLELWSCQLLSYQLMQNR